MYNVLSIDKSKNSYKKLAESNSGIVSAVFSASDINEIKDILKNERIDIIISDITIDKEDTFPLLEWIKSTYRTIPILIVTSNTSRDKVLKAASIGTMGYFLKPIDDKILLQKIKGAMDTFMNQHPERNYVRVRPLVEDVVELKFVDPKMNTVLSASLIDISLGGMAFIQSTDNYMGTIQKNDRLKINLKLNEYTLNLECDVVNTEGLRCNVKFSELQRIYQEILSNFIYRRIGAAN